MQLIGWQDNFPFLLNHFSPGEQTGVPFCILNNPKLPDGTEEGPGLASESVRN